VIIYLAIVQSNFANILYVYFKNLVYPVNTKQKPALTCKFNIYIQKQMKRNKLQREVKRNISINCQL